MKIFSKKGFLRGLVPCVVFIVVWGAWAIGYMQGSENPDQSMSLNKTV
ncbi:MAG: hypothetical protein ACKO5X_06490 [Limnohabitans sp.]|jgi:hypothetical protein